MKVKVVRNWADASNAWIDVQTYTGLKLPPPEIQYRLSFIDKDSIPAQMIVTSDGPSWVDGLGGGYKGKTVLNMTIEEPQVGSGGGGGGGIDTTRVYPDVIIVTGAGTPEANGLYIKVPVTEPDYNPVYKNSMRTMGLSCEEDEYWYIYDLVAQSALYGAAGGMTTPIADLEWSVEDGEEPAPTAMADTNYTGNAFDGDLVAADGEGGTKVIASPIAYTEMLTNISADGVGVINERPIFNNTGSNYTISRDLSEPMYSLTFDSPILSEKSHFLTVVPPSRNSGGNPTAVRIETNNSDTIYFWVCSSLSIADAFDGWSNLQLSIRIYY